MNHNLIMSVLGTLEVIIQDLSTIWWRHF